MVKTHQYIPIAAASHPWLEALTIQHLKANVLDLRIVYIIFPPPRWLEVFPGPFMEVFIAAAAVFFGCP